MRKTAFILRAERIRPAARIRTVAAARRFFLFQRENTDHAVLRAMVGPGPFCDALLCKPVRFVMECMTENGASRIHKIKMTARCPTTTGSAVSGADFLRSQGDGRKYGSVRLILQSLYENLERAFGRCRRVGFVCMEFETHVRTFI